MRVVVTFSDSKEQSKRGPLLLEGSCDTSGLTVHNSLVQPDMNGRVIVTIQNDTGFTDTYRRVITGSGDCRVQNKGK